MRAVDAVFTTEKNKSINQPIFLYTIYDYDGVGGNLYYAEYDTDINFPTGGQKYDKFPITHEYISENTSGEIDTVRVRVGNVSREIQAYLETYDLRGKKVIIKVVFADQLADADVYMNETFYIDSYTADENVVEFTLSGKIDILQVTLPGRRYMRNYCSWEYRGTECGAAPSGGATCNKTLQQCRDYVNNARFGGFPSIPSRRMVGL